MIKSDITVEIDPFFISYNNEYLPLSPQGEPKPMDDIPDYLLFNLLGCIQPIITGEIYSFHFIDGPDILIIIPWGEETTIIFQTANIENFKSDNSITVPTIELLYGIMQNAKNILDNKEWEYIFDDGREKLLLRYDRLKEFLFNHGCHGIS